MAQAQLGVVATFDKDVGLGTLSVGDEDVLPFHCTQITDGTREIEVGTRVSFELRPGRSGQWEAAALRRQT